MAKINGTQTINNILYLSVDVAPNSGSGASAPIGSHANTTDVSGEWYKFGSNDTDWVNILTTASGWLLNGNNLANDNTWIGSITDFDWSVRTNNVERLRILKTGEVGIGTATPTEQLTIQTGNIKGNSTDVNGFNILSAATYSYIRLNDGNIGYTSVSGGFYASFYNTWATNFNVKPAKIELMQVDGGTTISGQIRMRVDANTSGSNITMGAYDLSPARTLFLDVGGRMAGVNYNSPSATLHVVGSGSTNATFTLKIENSLFGSALYIQDNGQINASQLAVSTTYANNAAAIAGGRVVGDFYRTGADPDFIAIVH